LACSKYYTSWYFWTVQVVGKTVGIAYFLNLYCDYAEANSNNIDMEIILCDQKLMFAQKLGVENSKSFYYGEAVFSAIEEISTNFEQIKLKPDGKKRIIVIDEFVTLTEKLDPKRSQRLKSLLGVLIFETREYRLHLYSSRTNRRSRKFW
jgi:hypothetical protein